MTIEGNLRAVGFADICQLLSMGRKTGCLSVTDGSNFGYVYFEQGRVIYASVLNRRDRLGEILVGAGTLGREDLAEAMKLQAKNPRKRLGEILVEQGKISEDELSARVSVQIEEAVFHLFGWESGEFAFEPNRGPDEGESLLVSLNTESLLLEGARRVDEWSQIERHVPSLDLIFHVQREPEGKEEGQSELTEEQRSVLALVDGERTVDDIVIASGMVEFEVAKAMFGLARAGHVATEGERRAADPPEDEDVVREVEKAEAFYRAGMLDDAAKHYEAVLGHDGAHPRARHRLAVIAIRSNEPEAALEHLDALPEGRRESANALRNRAVALERLGRMEDALAALERAAEAAPDDEGVLLARAVALLKAGRPSDATSAFRRYRRQAGDDALTEIYFAYGILAAAAADDPRQAVRLGREGLTRYPSSSPVLVNLGVVLERQGEGEAAEALFLRAVQRSPPPPQAHKNLGDLAYRRGDRAGAQAHYERALRLDPSLGDHTYLRLGEIAYKDGDHETARQRWERAVELNPQNEVARSNLAVVGRVEES